MTRLSRWIDSRYAGLAVACGSVSALLGVLAREYDTFPGDQLVAGVARSLGERFEPVAYTFNELNGFMAVGLVAMIGGGLLWRRRFEARALFRRVRKDNVGVPGDAARGAPRGEGRNFKRIGRRWSNT